MHHKGTAKSRVAIIEAPVDLPKGGAEIHAGDSPAGQLGSADGQRGVAILRMDRISQAQAAGQPIRVDGLEVTITTPAWLTSRDGT